MHCRLETPVGTLWIEEADGAVSCVTSRPLSGPEGNAPVLEQAKKELTEYFAGTRKTFSVPLNPRGTDFQRAVWAALREIPYGETRSAMARSPRRSASRRPRGPWAARTTKTRF